MKAPFLSGAFVFLGGDKTRFFNSARPLRLRTAKPLFPTA